MSINGNRLKPSNGNESKELACKMVLLGRPGVGKTALTVRFLTRRFIGEYCPTLESVYKCHTQVDDDNVRLDILDTAGQAETGWKDGYAMWADCFVFVYSITDRDSFQEISQLKRHVESVRKSSSITGILVGNKIDLVHERQVTEAEASELADELGCRFYEVSAADWTQVLRITDMFKDLFKDYKRTRGTRDGRHRKTSSSMRFKQAIQKVITGKSGSNRRATTM